MLPPGCAAQGLRCALCEGPARRGARQTSWGLLSQAQTSLLLHIRNSVTRGTWPAGWRQACQSCLRARAGEGNVAIWGTPPDSIDDAEDRDKWYELLTRLDIRQPPGGMVTSEAGALAEAAKLGYPVRQQTPNGTA